jgi:uncharacterized coiled-coil DUF342 family protein
MTSSRYFVARVAQAFGYFRRSQRMADAASEMHLLREAEAQLGKMIWENVEGVEKLSVEYWNLRKFIKEKAAIDQKVAESQALLDQAHEERATTLNRNPEHQQEFIDQRIALLVELENLAKKRDQIVLEAREVRRAYDGMKMKLEVLSQENSHTLAHHEQVHQVKTQLMEFKAKFAELKEKRIQIGAEIEEGDHKVDQVDEILNQKKKERINQASETFQVISDGNKEISALRAESGLLDTQMRQLYAEIGRYVSRNTHHDPACGAAAASHQGLVEIMRALRRSIALNHRLAGTA